MSDPFLIRFTLKKNVWKTASETSITFWDILLLNRTSTVFMAEFRDKTKQQKHMLRFCAASPFFLNCNSFYYSCHVHAADNLFKRPIFFINVDKQPKWFENRASTSLFARFTILNVSASVYLIFTKVIPWINIKFEKHC